MSWQRIQPWEQEPGEELAYSKKLHTLTSFNIEANPSKGTKSQKFVHIEQIKKGNFGENENMMQTQNMFNKTNRSTFKHGVTKMIFQVDGNQNFKFEPISSEVKGSISRSLRKIPKISSQIFSKNRQLARQIVRSRKQIYYNLTEVNSPLNSIRRTVQTEEAQEDVSQKIKIFSRIHNYKKPEKSICRELSVERKIFMMQSGVQKPKFIIREKSKRQGIKNINIIEEICYEERNYEIQRRKEEDRNT